jgi:hypothetical protein
VASWTGIRRGTAGIASPSTLASFRQAKISPRETPCLRATSETFAPGVKLSSMIRAFSSSGQRRRRSTPFKISTGTGVYSILRTSLRSYLRPSTKTDKAVNIGCILMCFSHVSFSSVRRAMHGALRDRARERRFDKSSCQEQRVRDAKWQAHCHEGQREE